MSNLKLALKPFLFFLLDDEALERFGHGVERALQRRELISLLDFDAMVKFPAINMLRGFIKIGHRIGDGPSQANPNQQGDQDDDAENNGYDEQNCSHQTCP